MDAEEHPNQDHHLVRYVVALTAVAIGAAVALVLAGYSVGTIWVLVALCAAAAIAERASVRLSETLELSISPVPTLFAAVLFGPLAGGVVGAASELGDEEIFQRGVGRSTHLKWLTYTSTRFLAGAVM